jgi:hypothetical protein
MKSSEVTSQCIVGTHPMVVDLQGIEEAPGPYTMSFGFDLAALCESISEMGLVHPPCIAMEGQGRIEVVTGYRRILALKQLGRRYVSCEDVSSFLPSPSERLVFAFHDNRASIAFNAVEKAMILERLGAFFEKSDILERFMPFLSLPAHENSLSFYLKLAKANHGFKLAVAGGKVSLNAAGSLLDLNPDSAQVALRYIASLALNFNQQIQFLELMNDISEIETRGFSQILDDARIRAIVQSSNLNKPQKARTLLEELRSRRYPRLKHTEKRFREKVERLSLPEGTRIEHPPYFEAPGYSLLVRFKDGDNLMGKLQSLSRLSALREFRDPMDDDD